MEKDSKKRSVIPMAILIAGLLVGGALIFTGDRNTVEENQPAAIEETQKWTDPEGEGRALSRLDNILGNPNADVLIIEFSDIECPFCKELHNTMHEIIEEEGRDGRVAWVYRHFPIESIHPKAVEEARATECAAELGGNAKFWEYIDRLFSETPSNNLIDLSVLPMIAQDIGLDSDHFNACMKNPVIHDRVDQDLEDGIAAGITGTPYLLVFRDNQFVTALPGAQPYEVIKSAIDLAL